MRGRVLALGRYSLSMMLVAMIAAAAHAAGQPRSAAASAPLPPSASLACPVTLPPGAPPPAVPPSPPAGFYGNGTLWTILWLQGRVVFAPGGPGFVLPDGSLGMKWPWIPAVPVQPTVTGRRLDGAAAPAWAALNGPAATQDYQRFYPSYLIFPTPGCWEITARIGAASLTFVTLVVKVDGGPDRRPSSAP